jgi:hypothetical protein
MDEVEKYKEMIINGEITVPSTYTELEAFTPPAA